MVIYKDNYMKKRKQPQGSEAYSVQVDKRLLEKAKAKVNLPEAVRNLVSKIVEEDVCPCCGHPIK